MAFVVDGAEWRFDAWDEAEVEARLGRLAQRAFVARERGEPVWVGDDLQTRPVLGERDLWSLWAPDSPVRLSRELQEELVAVLAIAGRYLDEEPWPEGMEETAVGIDGEARLENPDVAWAHHRVRAGRATACLGLRGQGARPTETALGQALVHWVVDEVGHRRFFRDAIDLERDVEETLERLAPHAFPDLCFLPGAWRGLTRLEGGYLHARRELRQHLAVYDDHGRWAFTAPPPLETEEDPRPATEGSPGQRLIERRFALRGVEVAPEKPNVATDRRCREAREKPLAGRVLYLEWHGKLEPFRNRVHLHPPVPESGGRVVIGIFAAHLPLPGD